MAQDKAVLPSARSGKNSSHGHVTIRSLFLVGADVAVNNILKLAGVPGVARDEKLRKQIFEITWRDKGWIG